MKILTTNVAITDPSGAPTTLYEGQELPDWATDLVGDHALTDLEQKASSAAKNAEQAAQQAEAAAVHAEADAAQAKAAAETAEDAAEQTEDAEDETADDAPDFTGPAKTTRTRSSRKG
ncbi:hypothetical protein [Micrococcus sp.]|uniref:hypothetical protein n=1 Tax=Micrococcus sp. TaxID=1271 RepID=UPI0026DB841D|nr:hypothetical protein [Micrococcus sp.]MDO4240625.1 hypothetical protein [Micrococcus sp.]